MAIAMVLLLFPARLMPEKSIMENEEQSDDITRASKWIIAIGALAVFLLYTAIGSALSISSLLVAVGAAAATWNSTKYGRLLPSATGYILVGLGILLLFNLETIMFYTLASLVFKFSRWFTTHNSRSAPLAIVS